MVYHYLFARHKRDDRAINAMVDRAEKVAAGKRPLKKDRFVRIDAAGKGVDWDLVERARQLAGLKGYVTNLPISTMDGQAVVARLSRPLAGREVLPNGQIRPARPADLPP